MSIIIYSTLGCHLCEEAESLLKVAGVQSWTTIEISESEALVDRYGIKIPVLARCLNDDVSNELNWPFEIADLEYWLMNP